MPVIVIRFQLLAPASRAGGCGVTIEGRELMGKRPNVLVTDGLPAYREACNRE